MLPRLSPGFLARSAGLQVNGILMNASMFFDVDCFSSAPFSIWSALWSCMNACSAYFPAHLAQELLSDTRHTDQDSCAGVDMDTCEGLVLAMLHALLVDSHEGGNLATSLSFLQAKGTRGRVFANILSKFRANLLSRADSTEHYIYVQP